MVQKCAACSAGGAELAQDLLGGRTLGVYRCGEDAVMKIFHVNSFLLFLYLASRCNQRGHNKKRLAAKATMPATVAALRAPLRGSRVR